MIFYRVPLAKMVMLVLPDLLDLLYVFYRDNKNKTNKQKIYYLCCILFS